MSDYTPPTEEIRRDRWLAAYDREIVGLDRATQIEKGQEG